MSFNELDRAQILAEALPYIQKFTGKTIVVRYDSGADRKSTRLNSSH